MDDLGVPLFLETPHISEMNLYETHFEPGRQARLQPSESCCFSPLLRESKGFPKLQDSKKWNFPNGQLVMIHHFSDFCFCWVFFSNYVFFPHGIHKSTLIFKPQNVGVPNRCISLVFFEKPPKPGSKSSRRWVGLHSFLFSRGLSGWFFSSCHGTNQETAAAVQPPETASFGENGDRLRGGNHVDVVKLWGIYIQNKNIHNICTYHLVYL